jgi:hypothetical protein
MRRVVTLLERAPGREMTRKDLDAMLIAEGYYMQNMQNVPRDDPVSVAQTARVGLLEAAARSRGVPVPLIAGLATLPRELRRASGRRPGVGA